MPDLHPICGNCGQPVSASDTICPHCDVLLAAYASPVGSNTPYVYDVSGSTINTADAGLTTPAVTSEPEATANVGSTAPRPLYDTLVTIEDLARGADSDDDEPLVALTGDDAVRTATFAVPEYARPPVDAAPIPLLNDGDANANAGAGRSPSRPVPTPEPATITPASNASQKNAASPVPEERGESWLYDLSRNAPTLGPSRPVRERKDRPEPVRITTLPPSEQRGRAGAYLRKLHQQTGYQGSSARKSQPVQSRPPWSPSDVPAARSAGHNAKPQTAGRGVRLLLIGLLVLMWLGVIGGMLTGDWNPGLLVFTVLLTLALRLVGKPSPTTRHR